MPTDFERPRRAPAAPKGERADASSLRPKGLQMASPTKRKSSWFSSSPTREVETSPLKEEAPGLMSRSALLAGLDTPPKLKKDNSTNAKSPKTPTTASRISRVQEEMSLTSKNTPTSDITPTRSSIFSFRSASKQEKTPKTDEPKPKPRPLSITSIPHRPSSLSRTPKGFYSMMRGSPRSLKNEAEGSLEVLQSESERLADSTALPRRTSSIPDLPPMPPPNRPTSQLPALPRLETTRQEVDRVKSRKRSKSSVQRSQSYSKDPWHRNVYAHGRIQTGSVTSPTRVLAETYANAATPTQSHGQEEIDDLLEFCAKLLGPSNRPRRKSETLYHKLDAALIVDVASMSWEFSPVGGQSKRLSGLNEVYFTARPYM